MGIAIIDQTTAVTIVPVDVTFGDQIVDAKGWVYSRNGDKYTDARGEI